MTRNLQARLCARERAELPGRRRSGRYLHLVDGGLVDNLGVRGLFDHTVAGGSLDASFQNLPAGSCARSC